MTSKPTSTPAMKTVRRRLLRRRRRNRTGSAPALARTTSATKPTDSTTGLEENEYEEYEEYEEEDVESGADDQEALLIVALARTGLQPDFIAGVVEDLRGERT